MIVHIAPRQDWEAALPGGRYTADSLATEGFIHCSETRQVIAVANARFKGHPHLVLLWIDPSRLSSPVRYENLEGGADRFPHIYGPLNVDAVVDVTPFAPSADGLFDRAQLSRGVTSADL